MNWGRNLSSIFDTHASQIHSMRQRANIKIRKFLTASFIAGMIVTVGPAVDLITAPEPKMTSLPMGNTDSPLVIDLPDGQKLVVGNLAAGSVIEVATWRGTGRPDSRTSRLMLGMSSGQEKPADAAPVESKKAAPSFVGVILGAARGIIGKISSILSSTTKKSGEKKTSAPLIEKVTPSARTTDAAEVDDWLNSILEKSAKKPAAKAESAKSEPTTKPVKKAPVKKTAAKKSPKKTTARRAR